MVRFYTGFPRRDLDPFWHDYWANRFRALSRSGVRVVKRRLSYHMESIELPDGNTAKATVVREKGIDVRLSLDLFKMAVDGAYDAAIVFSQDQDLAEAVADITEHSDRLQLGIRVYSAFPAGPSPFRWTGLFMTPASTLRTTALPARVLDESPDSHRHRSDRDFPCAYRPRVP